MSLPETAYETALAAFRPGLRLAALFSEKGRRGVRGRSESLRRFREWAERERTDAPLVWVHAPSVGEALMAQATIRVLRERRPDLQVAFTHFSPSAERVVDEIGADVAGYVPWDTRGPVRRALRALRPTALVFVRTEVWPVVSRETAKAGCRLLLVNAVLSEGSGRLSRLGRAFLESAYRRLDGVGAVSDSHAERYELLGVPPGRIRVTGDARFDQVWERIERRGLFDLRGEPDATDRVPEELRPIWRVLHDPARFTFVAGSTWLADEKVLLPTLPVLRSTHPFRLILAPHEPTRQHLEALERRLDRNSLRHARLSALVAAGSPAPEAVVVDRLGVLADLYGLADAAYVGGGFGTSGLHSVVEPAALGVPVMFGPEHGNAREAGELAASGGGYVVEGPGEVETLLRRMIDDRAIVREAGEKARSFVRGETGAAVHNAELILEHL